MRVRLGMKHQLLYEYFVKCNILSKKTNTATVIDRIEFDTCPLDTLHSRDHTSKYSHIVSIA